MMPKTKLGKWAGILMAVFVVLFIIAVLNGGLRAGDPLSIILETCMMISWIAAFVTGTVSLIKFKDRSLVAMLAAGFGFIGVLIAIMDAKRNRIR